MPEVYKEYILEDRLGDYVIRLDDYSNDSFKITDTLQGQNAEDEHYKPCIIMKRELIPNFIKILKTIYSEDPDNPFKNITIKWKIK